MKRMTKRIRLTMAQALLTFLDNQYVEQDGVETKFVNGIFGIFGHGCVTGVGEALEFMEHNLKFYQGKNEQGMALAAMAYAKQMNRKSIIACVSSIGPGATNMVTAAACASANRIPLLVIPGDTFACRQPDPVLQQVEIFSSLGTTVNDAFKAVCRYFDRLTRPEQLMSAAMNAMRVLTDPADTGAVCLALPQDVEAEAYDYPEYFFARRVWHMDRRPLTVSQMQRAVELIKSSKKPMLVCGGGVRYSGAEKVFAEFAEKHNIPFGETQAGKGMVAWDHKMNLGGLGVTGTSAANKIGSGTDLVIGVGTRFSDFTTGSKWIFQNPDVKFLSLNICPFDAYKMNGEAIIGDARDGLAAIDAALDGYKTGYIDEFSKAKKEWDDTVDELYKEEVPDGLSQVLVVGEINKFARAQDIVVCAAGSLPGDLQRVWRPGNPGSYHVEYGYSNMGYDLNGALGVKIASPESEVFAMVGDGGYLMLNSEVYTMVQEHLKVNICLFDNQGWGCIENLQNANGGHSFGTVFTSRDQKTGRLTAPNIPVDFAMNAESLGCKGYRISTLQELRDALEDSKKANVPVLFDIKVVPGSMTHGYESWWRVGIAEVSNSASVEDACKKMHDHIDQARDY